MYLDNDVIGLGYRRGEYFHLMVTVAGLDKIPLPFKTEKSHADGYVGVYVMATKPNMIALVLGGYITPGDAKRCYTGELS